MKKAILLGLVLVILSIIPGSFTASEVSAQGETTEVVPSRSCSYGASGYFTTGAILKVELGNTESILLRCRKDANVNTYSWENVAENSVLITTHTSMIPEPRE